MSDELTLRDRFAMAAMTGLLGGKFYSELLPHGYVKDAYKMADAIMDARQAHADPLTAAAPDMLIVGLEEVCRSRVGDSGPSRAERMIRAAIAKARGL